MRPEDDDGEAGDGPQPAGGMEEFLRSVERRGFLMARLALGNEDDALDALQDTMMRLVQRYATRPAQEWRPLFYRMLHNRITDARRRRKIRARLFGVVLRQITQLLESLDMPLPWYTQLIISGSHSLRVWWWALVALGILAGVAFRAIVRTERGRASWDGLKLRVPVFGRVIRILAISRFTRTVSTLLAGGIPIVKALEISKFVAGNVVLGDAVERVRESITEGSSIAAPLRRSGHFPPLVTHMVDVGEKSGELESMLAKVADTYDEQVETAVTRLTALLEPALILIMVGIVLFIILSTLVPLLQLTSAIR